MKKDEKSDKYPVATNWVWEQQKKQSKSLSFPYQNVSCRTHSDISMKSDRNNNKI